jgi:hypothetical protein
MTTGLSVMARRQDGWIARTAAWLRSRGVEAGALRLAADGTVSLAPRGRALTLSARGGTVLVTQAGDPHDHVLAAGETVRLAARGLVVVWALTEAAVSVERRAA